MAKMWLARDGMSSGPGFYILGPRCPEWNAKSSGWEGSEGLVICPSRWERAFSHLLMEPGAEPIRVDVTIEKLKRG